MPTTPADSLRNTAHTNRDNAGIALPKLHRGQPIQLARWTHTISGWHADIIDCRYQSHSPTIWRVAINDTTAHYPRADWTLCLP